ncbi:M23 family metallopeptidase [Paenibacillus sp. BC26]|uniref:M23 family metallopeptidase n=1 Tax=Paenibacillus sp. BC26 TaxID=1881032 RepID=UPI0008E3B2E8|nr:M23 family metallopeptidase [Paenibacillus sp. BC26]SFT19533.1 Peptidase family M23 [Paenibacillus sp. BC26]
MKLLPRNTHFTFLVLPDGSKPALRFRVSTALLLVIPILISLLIVIASTLYLLHERNSHQLELLQLQLASESDAHQDQLADKEAIIVKLQTDLVQLAQQADAVDARMEELSKLESDMKSLVGLSSDKTAKETDGDGVGGEQLDATDADIRELAEQTKSFYTSIGGEISELKNRLTSTRKEVQKKKQVLRLTPTYWPTESERITSLFGVRIDPFTNHPGVHKGMDIAGKTGDSIFAAADGYVQDTGYMTERGNYIVVSHKNGIATKYMHLNKVLAQEGERVEQGDLIGLLGSTGRSTGPHLHFEVMKYGVSVDPKPYLKMGIKGIPTDVQLEKRQD